MDGQATRSAPAIGIAHSFFFLRVGTASNARDVLFSVEVPQWLRWIVLNAFFAVCHPAVGDAVGLFPPLLSSLAVNAALFVMPAVGWIDLVPVRWRPRGLRLFTTIVLSTVALFGMLALIRAVGLPANAGVYWSLTWGMANAGFACAFALRRRRRRIVVRRFDIHCGGAFLVSYAIYLWAATNVVPPQNDHDLEVQATGYSLVTRFDPFLLTDRGTTHYFAHPPLLHYYAGVSFLLYGEFDALRYYYDISTRAVAQADGQATPFLGGKTYLFGAELGTYDITGRDELAGVYLLTPERGGEEVSVPYERVESGRIYRHYDEAPYALETRTPNVFLAAAATALLVAAVSVLSGYWWLGALLGAAYATSPEIVVRSSYGGYFSVGVLATIAILIAAYRSRRIALPLATGLFAALVDHKLVLLPAAIGLNACWRFMLERTLASFKALFNPQIIGFVLGTVAFWLYGFAISPEDFVNDHLRHHLVDRVVHNNALGYEGYATKWGLWSEFLSHTGYLLVPFGLGFLIWDVVRNNRSVPQRIADSRRVWLLFVLLTGLVFTAIDWRMTKHVVLVLIPLTLALASTRHVSFGRLATVAMLGFVTLIINGAQVLTLVTDFYGYTITPAW